MFGTTSTLAARLKDRFVRWREGFVSFHPWNLPETRDPTRFSSILYDDWAALSSEMEGVHAERLLEIGCNYGRWIPWLSDHAEAYFAVEPVAEALEIARSRHPDVAFHRGLAEDMPYPDGHFDCVVSWGVLMHVPHDRIEATMEEIKRVTAEDGLIVLGEEVGDTDGDIVYRRSLDEWKRLLRPKTLVSTTLRESRFTDDLVHERQVMTFR